MCMTKISEIYSVKELTFNCKRLLFRHKYTYKRFLLKKIN